MIYWDLDGGPAITQTSWGGFPNQTHIMTFLLRSPCWIRGSAPLRSRELKKIKLNPFEKQVFQI